MTKLNDVQQAILQEIDELRSLIAESEASLILGVILDRDATIDVFRTMQNKTSAAYFRVVGRLYPESGE